MKNRLSALLIIFTLVLFSSCNLPSAFDHPTPEVTSPPVKDGELLVMSRNGDLRFEYYSRSLKGKVKSRLRIMTPDKTVLAEVNCGVDTNISGYEERVGKDVLIEANRILNNNSDLPWTTIEAEFEKCVEGFKDQAHANEGNALIMSQLNKAVIQTVSRAIKTGRECQCTPVASFSLSRGAFQCKEDLKKTKN
jgi:hypothetical protein